jgi:hypothetical protein
MTFCVHTQTELVVSTCPLRKGRCYWQHRETKTCKYTTDTLSFEEYCLRVGTQLPSEQEKQLIFNNLKSALNP